MGKIKKYKICRRLGASIYEKCQTQTFTLRSENKRGPQKKRPSRRSDYGQQLIEKQKVRFMYGVQEKQFSRYVKDAHEKGSKESTPAALLFEHLEYRLDNIVYRLGLAKTRMHARQVSSHGHILVNGKRTTSPSYRLKPSDVVAIREGSKATEMFKEIKSTVAEHKVPSWLVWDTDTMEAKVVGTPKEPDQILNFQVVIEFYSR